MRTLKKLYYDVDGNILYTSNTSGVESDIPILFADTKYVMGIELLSNSAGYDVSDIVTWSAAYGNPKDSIISAANATFNSISDWVDVDTVNGKISFQLDLNNDVDLIADFSNAASKIHYLQVQGNDGSDTRTIMLTQINTNNTVA